MLFFLSACFTQKVAVVSETFPSVIVKTLKSCRGLALSEVQTGQTEETSSRLLTQNALSHGDLRTPRQKQNKQYKISLGPQERTLCRGQLQRGGMPMVYGFSDDQEEVSQLRKVLEAWVKMSCQRGGQGMWRFTPSSLLSINDQNSRGLVLEEQELAAPEYIQKSSPSSGVQERHVRS